MLETIFPGFDDGSRTATEAAFDKIDNPEGEGKKTFISLFRDQALAQADAIDTMTAAGLPLPALAGLPVAIKDLFNIAGRVTTAGSKVLANNAPAKRDAVIVTRLRAAGAVILGRTNMTEMAYSGLGLNPHFGTPASPWDRATRRIPGGSSSGSAVAVADGMAAAAVGTDTGGSVRIPAALCGLVGFKPSQHRVPLEGVFPLAESLDSVGPLARSVAQCAHLDAIMAGQQPSSLVARPLKGLRLAVPANYLLEDMDDTVAAAFQGAVDKLSAAGAMIFDLAIAEFDQIPGMAANGGLAAAEALALHRATLASRQDEYDPRVATRIARGAAISAADYIDLLHWRTGYIAAINQRLRDVDAMLCPTVPQMAPAIARLESDDDHYQVMNLLMLRNCTAFNLLDGCAISLPCHQPGQAAVGLMIAAPGGGDRKILEISLAIETLLQG